MKKLTEKEIARFHYLTDFALSSSKNERERARHKNFFSGIEESLRKGQKRAIVFIRLVIWAGRNVE